MSATARTRVITWLYAFFLFLLFAYSYVLIDPNITLFNNAAWADAREALVQIGYYQRPMSSAIYCVAVILLFVFHFYFIRDSHIKLRDLLIPLAVFGVLSYPLLSHDFFNYMFDAKILTTYHLNPYTHRALDFPQDPWIRFMHWTHRTYPYGPTFLLLTLIPAALSMGKFILAFYLLKGLFVGMFVLAAVLLARTDRKSAIIFTTHPLIIIEGLMNGHNDLLALSLALIGIYYVFKKQRLLAFVWLLISGGIKYITLPAIGMIHPQKRTRYVGFALIFGLILYVSFKMEVQPWYFMSLFVILPYLEGWIEAATLSTAGLLFSYYPYIRYGEWNLDELWWKHWIIILFVGLNIFYLLLKFNLHKKARHTV